MAGDDSFPSKVAGLMSSRRMRGNPGIDREDSHLLAPDAVPEPAMIRNMTSDSADRQSNTSHGEVRNSRSM